MQLYTIIFLLLHAVFCVEINNETDSSTPFLTGIVNQEYTETISGKDSLNKIMYSFKLDDNPNNLYRLKAEMLPNINKTGQVVIIIMQLSMVGTGVVLGPIYTPNYGDGNYFKYPHHVEQTLCIDTINEFDYKTKSGTTFWIEFQSVSQSVEVAFKFVVVQDSHMVLDEGSRQILTSPSSPVFYKVFPKPNLLTMDITFDIDQEHVSDAVKNKQMCYAISIQKLQCPVNNHAKNVYTVGYWESISSSGILSIKMLDFLRDGFMLVIVPIPTFCPEVDPFSPPRKGVTTFYRGEQSPISRKREDPSMKPDGLPDPDYISITLHTVSIPQTTGSPLIFTLGLVVPVIVIAAVVGLVAAIFKNQAKLLLGFSGRSRASVVSPSQVSSKSTGVGSIVLFVLTFYSPSLYRVGMYITQILNGINLVCDFNYKCSYSVGSLETFNHFWSHIGYIIFGLVLVSVIGYVESSVTMWLPKTTNSNSIELGSYLEATAFVNNHDTTDESRSKTNKMSLKQSILKATKTKFQVLKVVAVALVVEALFTAALTNCPNLDVNHLDYDFQMVLAILIILNFYHMRHPRILNTRQTFALLAAFRVILMCIKFILKWLPFPYDLVLLILTVIFAGICIEIISRQYCTGRPFTTDKFNHKNLFDIASWKSRTKTATPKVLLPVTVIIGTVLLILSWFYFQFDLSTYFLYQLILIGISYRIFYTCMKIRHHEFTKWKGQLGNFVYVSMWLLNSALVMYTMYEPFIQPIYKIVPKDCQLWFPYYDEEDITRFLSSASILLAFVDLLLVDGYVVRNIDSKLHTF